MSKQDRQKLSIFLVLLGVLGLTIVLGYRMNQPPTTAAVQPPPAQKTSDKSPAPNEAHIRLDLLANPEADGQHVGKRNLFQYWQAPPPPPPTSLPPRGGPPPGPMPPPPTTTVQNPNPAPITPPPPPINLKYQGFAQNPGLIAFLADDTRHYNVTVGEVLMGRYRIINITDKTVEVEDLQFNRRQMLPLLK
jgi:hypothetical protein